MDQETVGEEEEEVVEERQGEEERVMEIPNGGICKTMDMFTCICSRTCIKHIWDTGSFQH